MSEAVRVMVRVRPMNQKEKDRGTIPLMTGCVSVVDTDMKNKSIYLKKEDNK